MCGAPGGKLRLAHEMRDRRLGLRPAALVRPCHPLPRVPGGAVESAGNRRGYPAAELAIRRAKQLADLWGADAGLGLYGFRPLRCTTIDPPRPAAA